MSRQLSFKEKSLLFAKLSHISYSDDIKEVKAYVKELGFTQVKFYDNNGAQAYKFSNNKMIVIACRGTQPNQFNDIKADLKAFKVFAETVGLVHKGFKKEVDDIWPNIAKNLKALKKERALYFCGHSLGAAMATLMASRCQEDPELPKVEELYTYGSPRVGDIRFTDSLSVLHYRWVNNNDIVARVPFALLGYRHDGTEYYMNAYGKVRTPTGWQRIKDRIRGFWFGIKKGKIDNFSDHSIIAYIYNLDG